MLQYEEEINFLHGTLKIHVIEARDLPDTDSTFFNISRGDWTDPYVVIFLDKTEICKTAYLQNNLDPVWDEIFSVDVCHHASSLRVKVMDREHIGAETVGTIFISTDDIVTGEPVEGWWDLMVNNKGDVHGQVHIMFQLFPVGSLSVGKMLSEAYFEPREGCKMTIYQDADTPDLEVFQGVTEPDGSPYKPTRLWMDLYQSLEEAQKLIYVTGWSVFTGISLVRGEEAATYGDTNVGELLKKKASEGVRVLVMTWNEKSNDTGMIEGMMGTHDEDTYRYFKDSDVICENVPRQKKSWLGLGNEFVSTMYTHHQKTVICDADIGDGSGRRRLIGYVGGIDITDGRYDNPKYHLFRTIFSLHAGDFYQHCTMGVDQSSGPRQPWHDIHAKVEGPIVYDVMTNFTDRWIKQNPNQIEAVLDVEDDEDIDLNCQDHHSTGGQFVVQLLRSITIDSALMNQDRSQFCHRKYGRLIDNSIQRQYINLIRNAVSYIYIENQYFLGSAFSWLEDNETLSHHLIPREITQKIINKIEARESFHVYVCIPMYPEGDPSTAPSQEILFWQFRTIESMYKRIAIAIEKNGCGTHPTDHLSFYCLGKREGPEDIEPVLSSLSAPAPATGAEKVRETLRHPIYVHSKLMIVDDDYIVIGSANINQRSMAGERDSEICVGAFQPDHSISDGLPRGDIHSFRMALWSAHLGGFSDQFENPNSAECLEYVRNVTSQFWEIYTADEPAGTDVHLLPYPYSISETGDVSSLEYPWDCFPDTSASVIGAKSGILPMKLTT